MKTEVVLVMDGHIILYLETSILMKIKILLGLMKNYRIRAFEFRTAVPNFRKSAKFL